MLCALTIRTLKPGIFVQFRRVHGYAERGRLTSE
jgi:hypothetical protein